MNRRLQIIIIPTLSALLASGVQGSKTTTNSATDYTPEDLRLLTPPVKAMTIGNIRLFVDRNAYTPQFANGRAADYPMGTGGLIYADGIIWGGLMEDGQVPRLRANGSQYAAGLKAGKVLLTSSGQLIGSDDPETRHVWRVRKDYRKDYQEGYNYNYYYSEDGLDLVSDAAKSFGLDWSDISQLHIEQLHAQYKYDWQNWPADEGAPYDDVDGDGHYNPEIDIPGFPGADQTIWLVANDIPTIVDGDTVDVSMKLFGSPSIGLEMQMTIWGYAKGFMPYLENVLFKKVRLIYTGNYATPDTAHIDSMYLAQWSDPDLGVYTDDYIGIDVEADLAYVYNANAVDGEFMGDFGLPVPAGGYSLLQGPFYNGQILGLSSFADIFYSNPLADPTLGTYDLTLKFWNALRGFMEFPHTPDTPWIDPLTGEATKFPLAGDPVTQTGWVDGIVRPPGDRRMLMSCGPFSMALGDTQEIVIATIGGIGQDALSSLGVLRRNNRFVKIFQTMGFEDLSQLYQPTLAGFGGDGYVALDWGSDLEAVAAGESVSDTRLVFEGYNICQLPSEHSPLDRAIKIATFDKYNQISSIIENRFDENAGAELPVVTQQGTNSGIQRHLRIDRDVIRNRPITNDRPYYYAVTSYYYLPNAQGRPVMAVESKPSTITVTPQQPAPGSVYPVDSGDTLQIAHTAGQTTGNVRAQVVNPDELMEADWEVYFAHFDPTTGERVEAVAAGDTLTDGSPVYDMGWNLDRDGLEILTNQTPIYATVDRTQAAPILNGMQIIVQDAGTESGDVKITADDRFAWSSASKVIDNREAALKTLDKINVYPNPYLGRHGLQANRHNRWVRFTHLPQRATIRIFSLGGTMVKIMEKDDPTQYLTWDLTNQGRFLVASGIYIAHIELPDYGQVKILKLAVVQQEVILDIY